MDYSNEQLRALAREFCPAGLDKDPVPLGNGHINDTFLFESEGRSHVCSASTATCSGSRKR